MEHVVIDFSGVAEEFFKGSFKPGETLTICKIPARATITELDLKARRIAYVLSDSNQPEVSVGISGKGVGYGVDVVYRMGGEA